MQTGPVIPSAAWVAGQGHGARGARSGSPGGHGGPTASVSRDHCCFFTQNLFGKMADILEKIKK